MSVSENESIFEKDVNEYSRHMIDGSGHHISELSEIHVNNISKARLELRRARLSKRAFDILINSMADEGNGSTLFLESEEVVELVDDLNTVLGLSNEANASLSKTEKTLEECEQNASQHLEDNFYGYVEVATAMANNDLKDRIGQRIIVHSTENPVVGFAEVNLVNPALRKEDVKV